MPQPDFDVVLAADMCVDLVLHGNVRPHFKQVEQLIDGYCLEAGGSANIFASQMAKLGARASVIGRVGADAFGTFLLERLAAAGIDTSLVRTDAAVQTGLGVALAEPGDRAILTYPGTIAAVTAEELPRRPELICRHWHIASFFLLDGLRSCWKDFLTRCRAAGVTTSLDPNWDPEDRWEGLFDLLPLLDVFLPNDREAMAITGISDAVDAGRRLSKSGPLVVVKCGENGAIAVRGAESWTLNLDAAAAAPAAIVDSVGAGDNFDAGFLRAWLLGRTVPECLELAHRCAVASLSAAGGITGQIVEADLLLAGRSPR